MACARLASRGTRRLERFSPPLSDDQSGWADVQLQIDAMSLYFVFGMLQLSCSEYLFLRVAAPRTEMKNTSNTCNTLSVS